MKFALMAEPGRIGNADPWNLVIRPITSRPQGAAENGTKTTKSSRPIADFTDFTRVCALRWIFAVAVLVAMAGAPDVADVTGRWIGRGSAGVCGGRRQVKGLIIPDKKMARQIVRRAVFQNSQTRMAVADQRGARTITT
jgi:hypothetical protein